MKDETPFGQLPYLVDDGLKIGQSMAIARYVGQKAGLQGEGKDFAISEMLIEEQNDLYNILAKAMYHPVDKTAAWKTALEVEIPKQFGLVENLLHGDYFGSKLTTGDVAIWSIVNIILDVDAKAVDAYPKLKAHYARLSSHPGVQAYLKHAPSAYFKTA